MAFRVLDLVWETSTTTGTGAFTLGGAKSVEYRTFSGAGMANGDTIYYSARNPSTSEWEVGLGTWNTGGTLSRTTILASSNAGAAVTFSAGTKDIEGVHPASAVALMINPQTWTGQQTFGDGSGFASIRVNGAAGQSRAIDILTNGLLRFRIVVNSTAESGSNAGSNLQIIPFADDGTTPLTTALTFSRANSQTTIQQLILNTALAVAQGGTGATTLTGMVKGNGASAMSAAVVGTDYAFVNRAVQDVVGTLTSQTALQKIFSPTGATNGAFTVSAGKRYVFRVVASFGSLSATSSTISFGLLGTATFTDLQWWADANKGAATPTAVTNTRSGSATGVAVTSATTTTTGYMIVTGYFTVNAGGTVIPAIGMSVAAAGVVAIGSHMDFEEIPAVFNGAFT